VAQRAAAMAMAMAEGLIANKESVNMKLTEKIRGIRRSSKLSHL